MTHYLTLCSQNIKIMMRYDECKFSSRTKKIAVSLTGQNTRLSHLFGFDAVENLMDGLVSYWTAGNDEDTNTS